MRLTAKRENDLAREVASERIFEGAGLDFQDLLKVERDGDDVWVTCRVLVKRELIESLAKVRAEQARRAARRRARKGARS